MLGINGSDSVSRLHTQGFIAVLSASRAGLPGGDNAMLSNMEHSPQSVPSPSLVFLPWVVKNGNLLSGLKL